MWKRMTGWLPGRRIWRKLMLAAIVVGVGALAFCWGRRGALSEVKANPPPEITYPILPANNSDYGRRVVAYIYNNIPITRQDLGEFLIARLGTQRLEQLINRRIVEIACQNQNPKIYVTDAEVESDLHLQLQTFPTPVSLKDFETLILQKYNKNLYEWKEDVIRPRLLLTKLARPRVVVTEQDIREAFESRYGDKVKCRMIVFMPQDRRVDEAWVAVNKSEEKFLEYAKQQALPRLASKAGEIPPIFRHFPDPKIETAAFKLKTGEVSEIIELADRSKIILRCEGREPPDTTKRLEMERNTLYKEVHDRKLAQEIPRVFKELRDQARPQSFLRDLVRQEDLERSSLQLINQKQPAPK